MSGGLTFWCDDTEYELIYLDGCIPFYTPIYEQEDLDDCLDYDERAYLQGDYDEEVYEDEDVQKSIEDRVRHEYEHPLARADREAEERMNIPPSPHLSQPDEDIAEY